MIFYRDTSVLVTLLTGEIDEARVTKWLKSVAHGEIASSEWVSTEFAAAISVKARMGAISAENHAGALARYKVLAETSFGMFPVTERYFRTAAQFAGNAELGWRAGDALHLAIAASGMATVVTRDRKMASAATALGIGIHLL